MDKQTIGKGIIDGTLVRIEASGDFLALTTYSRSYGRSQRFLISRDLLENLHVGNRQYDMDIYSFLVLHRDKADLRIRITWLSGSFERVHGHIEDITIPFENLKTHLMENRPICHLHRENKRRVKLDFSGASRTIREICAQKQRKRAFLKGLARNFLWKFGETVRFYNDGNASFFFREGDDGLCGGLILHCDLMRKEPGQEARLYYSVHT